VTARRMRAVVVRTFGDVSELVVEERPVPEPGPTEVLVRVVAAGVNPVD
jgi:NADPH:quinone reductase-like Zn-dependent oxidoreductase